MTAGDDALASDPCDDASSTEQTVPLARAGNPPAQGISCAAGPHLSAPIEARLTSPPASRASVGRAGASASQPTLRRSDHRASNPRPTLRRDMGRGSPGEHRIGGRRFDEISGAVARRASNPKPTLRRDTGVVASVAVNHAASRCSSPRAWWAVATPGSPPSATLRRRCGC